ncbi:MAG: metallophosphoesterase family protein [Anaerolineae bacterium]|nr:metallophosphoesterase family protein [Anaerolineae bacterium]
MGNVNTHLPPTIPADREGRYSFLHCVFIITGVLGRLSAVTLLPVWAGLIALACWPWRGSQLFIAGLVALVWASDWGALALLPRYGRSWGPVTPSLLALMVLRVILSWLFALTLGCWAPPHLALGAFAGVMVLLSAVLVYATWVEPFRVGVTQQTLCLEKWTAPPLRVLHISDVHFEGDSPRERAVLAQVRALRPDLILVTGDYLNISSVYDTAAQSGARAWLAQLSAPLGVYAVTGSAPVDVVGIIPEIFSGLPIHWLRDATSSVVWHDCTLWLMGVTCTVRSERDATALAELRAEIPDGAPNILLYHTPDLMPKAVALGVDLYLAGHTHGGQLCLPFYGALFTSSQWGKKYEAGRYHEGQTTLYVSRGLGMEGLGAPRARFLAPPELILWELRGDSD